MTVFTAQALLGLALFKCLLGGLEKTFSCEVHTAQTMFRSINFTRSQGCVGLSLPIRWKPLISQSYSLTPGENSYVLILMYGWNCTVAFRVSCTEAVISMCRVWHKNLSATPWHTVLKRWWKRLYLSVTVCHRPSGRKHRSDQKIKEKAKRFSKQRHNHCKTLSLGIVFGHLELLWITFLQQTFVTLWEKGFSLPFGFHNL